jgi:pimeloyl-ACP methyl ester carboxylesterase
MGKLVNQGYTAVVPDFGGAGESSASKAGYDKKTIAQDMRALMNSLGFNNPAVVGHDIGLNIACLYAAQFSWIRLCQTLPDGSNRTTVAPGSGISVSLAMLPCSS